MFLRFLICDLPYRLYALRRLIVVCVLVVGAGAIASFYVTPNRGPLTDPRNLTMLLTAWALVIMANAIIFPAGWIDAVCASLSASAVAAASPLFFNTLAGASKGATAIGAGISTLTLILFWMAGWLVSNWVFCTFGSRIPMGLRRHRMRYQSPMPPTATRNAISLSPNQSGALSVCGPTDATGIFPVRFVTTAPDPQSFDLVKTAHDYHARILHEDLETKEMEIFLEIDATQSSAHITEMFEPDGVGTLYSIDERHNHFNLVAAIGFWITDYGRDRIRGQIDLAQDLPTPAISLIPQRTALTSIARLFTWRRNAST